MKLRILLIALLLATGIPASASTLSVESPSAAARATFTIPVYLDTQAESINAVEGFIHVPEGVLIDSVTSAGSALTLFVREPSYSLSDRTISFTGGAPKGIAAHTHALLLTIRAHAETSGSYTFKPTGFIAYRNDGQGTPLSISTQPIEVAVGKEGSAKPSAASSARATPLIAEIGKDSSLFDANYFMIISGGDTGTGVDHYEVREGLTAKPAVSERFYLLRDQKREHSLLVTAVNHDGKMVSTFVIAANPWKELGVVALILLVLAAAGYLVSRILRRRV